MAPNNAPEISAPSHNQISELASDIHLELTDKELKVITGAAEGMMGVFQRLEQLEEPKPPVEYPDRNEGERVPDEDDPLNAWITRCHVEGSDDGSLAGMTVGLKDSIALAGVEMTMGSRLMEGYVPNYDATLVTRLLDEGATITGKLNMEAVALSASGELSDFGPVLNPRSADHLSGGSSSGSAAAVVAGDVDVAIGTDQAGSVRIPASWSGCVGHKPTHTLVPYTGIGALGHTFDHAGPMGTNVSDVAKVLGAIAGKDPLDPRQGAVPTDEYAASVADTPDPSKLSIGVIEEGFGQEESMEEVDETVREALDALADVDATVEEVSIPWHHDGEVVFLGFAMQETTELFLSEGQGYFGKGFYDTHFADEWGKARRESAEAFPPFPKLEMVMGRYLKEEYRSRFHAKAQNLRRSLAEAYDEQLTAYDVLALPTTSMTAHDHIGEPGFGEGLDRAADMISNTAPFDVTGHPAITIPCGTADGLPVGLQFVGDQFDDTTVLRAARAYEATVGLTM